AAWPHAGAALTRLLDQPIGRGLDLVLQALDELALVEPRRDRIEDLHHHRSGMAEEGAARPEQAGIQRDRQAWHAFRLIEMRDAEFVARLSGDGAPRAFREDDQLPPTREFDACALGHRGERLRASAAIDRDHAALDGEPAEDWDPLQLALHDEGWAVEQGEQCEGL